jgi:hypothetical protein
MWSLLPGRNRIWAVAAAAITFALVHSTALLLRVPLWRQMPLPLFRPYDQVAARMADYLIRKGFLSLTACLGPLALGVAAALIVTSEAWHRFISRSVVHIRGTMLCYPRHNLSSNATCFHLACNLDTPVSC